MDKGPARAVPRAGFQLQTVIAIERAFDLGLGSVEQDIQGIVRGLDGRVGGLDECLGIVVSDVLLGVLGLIKGRDQVVCDSLAKCLSMRSEVAGR